MTSDPELLSRYCDQRDEAAFAELVHRHVTLVYSTALRLAGGDVPLAEDVTQTVFTDLVRKANQLRGHETVAGWLHTGARFAAAKAIRAERLRRTREQEASAMHDTTTTIDDNNWAQMRPLIDEAVGHLGTPERNAVLLRFFQEKSYREIGDLLGVSEDAARMRVERALERLRGQFARRGLMASAALIASALGANAATTPAADFSAALVQRSLASATLKAGVGKFSSAKVLGLLAGASALAATTAISFAPWRNGSIMHEKSSVAFVQPPAAGKTPTVAGASGNPVALLAPAVLTPTAISTVASVELLANASQDVSMSDNSVNLSSQSAPQDSSTQTSPDPTSPNTPNTDNSAVTQPPASPAAMVTGIAIFEASHQDAPDFVDTSGILEGKTIIAIANGGDHKLALCSDGTLVTLQKKAVRPPPSSRGRQSGMRNGRTIVVVPVPPDIGSNNNTADQAENATATFIPVLVDTSNIPEREKITAIAAGAGSNIAICSDGSVYVWGAGQARVAGRQALTPSAQPKNAGSQANPARGPANAVAIPTLLSTGALKGRKATAIGVGAGGLFGLALCSDGALVSWGDNSCFQMGDAAGSRVGRGFQGGAMRDGGSDPQIINNKGDLQGKTVKAISTSWYDGLVLCSDGTVIEWGSPNPTPVTVEAGNFLKGKTIAAIAAGGEQSGLMLCADSTLAGWSAHVAPEELERLPASGGRGAAARGAARSGSVVRGAPKNSPDLADNSSVLGGKTVTAISVRGRDGYFILCSDGTLATWSGGKPVLQDCSGTMKGMDVLAIAPDMVLFQEQADSSDQTQ